MGEVRQGREIYSSEQQAEGSKFDGQKGEKAELARTGNWKNRSSVLSVRRRLTSVA